MRRIGACCILILFLIGCGDGEGIFGLGVEDCDKKINETYATYGTPDNVWKYDQDTYHSWYFYYFKYKFVKTFTWDHDMTCEVGTLAY